MKIIIWGYKLHSHTHSYIHYGFWRAAHYLGHETHWFDDKDDVSGFDFSGSIFITECNASKGMPIRKDCSYVVHNMPHHEDMGRVLNIQYMTYDAMRFEKVADGITYYERCLFFPWGSPLLPHEFNFDDIDNEREPYIAFIGTLNGKGDGGNWENVQPFIDRAYKAGYYTIAGGGYTGKKHYPGIKFVNNWMDMQQEAGYYRWAYMSPALQGNNQLSNGMIPCRLFKAISYGNDGITNNKLAYEYFNGEIVFNADTSLIFDQAIQMYDKARIRRLMQFVSEKHTYLNTLNTILKIL